MKKVYDRGLALGTGKSILVGKPVYTKTHVQMAAKIFDCAEEDVTEEQRQAVKRARYLELYSHRESMFNKDKTIIQQDFASIEARVLAWANENRNKSIYNAHKRNYDEI